MKLETYGLEDTEGFDCNYLKSLLGIETKDKPGLATSRQASDHCNYLKSLLGIETDIAQEQPDTTTRDCNYLKSLLGIETAAVYPNALAD